MGWEGYRVTGASYRGGGGVVPQKGGGRTRDGSGDWKSKKASGERPRPLRSIDPAGAHCAATEALRPYLIFVSL